MMRLFVAALALSLALASCGRKGDPIPPQPNEEAQEEDAAS
ncbi:MAG: LPS translocon maturation chaperone LptM [Pikeienuella sp.]